ncbi:MAG TPA: serine hydrolase, partial [Phnomibacter sp.]|nr:serine hydrolase [Phnomibacter sp.]
VTFFCYLCIENYGSPMRTRLLLWFLLPVQLLFAQRNMKQLEMEMLRLTEGFKGDIGFYVEEIKTGKHIGSKADTIFPTASIVKVPILIGVMDKIGKGELEYHQKLTYRDSLLYEGEDILGSFKDGEKIELSKVMMLMLALSDNTASLWLQRLAGTGTRINELMADLGLTHTRVNSRTPGREEFQKRYGWGQSTPREMASLFNMIWSGKVVSPGACERMIRLMGRNHWDEEALIAIPPGVFVASKSGAVNASRSEVLLVNGKRPYIFSIFTKNNTDKSWETGNEAWELTRKLSALVWKYFDK